MVGLLGFSSFLGVTSVLLYQVHFGDDSSLRRSAIIAKIKEETTIYYDDEESPMGSFFEDTHRQYVPIEDVPGHLINAFIA